MFSVKPPQCPPHKAAGASRQSTQSPEKTCSTNVVVIGYSVFTKWNVQESAPPWALPGWHGSAESERPETDTPPRDPSKIGGSK